MAAWEKILENAQTHTHRDTQLRKSNKEWLHT